jgi:hypothetical protein
MRWVLEKRGVLSEAAALMAARAGEGVDINLVLCGHRESIARRVTDPTIIDWLRIRGISARLTSGARPHHLRVVLGDDRHLLIGSHLWSISGVSQYVQTSILIDSPEIGESMSDYLESL